MFKITSKTQNITGYWGEVDTTTNFCEPHYSFSPLFAEFFNAWSSLIYVAIGLYLIKNFPKDVYVVATGLWLIAIGVGSFLFHATMRYAFQLTDELPMVGLVLTLVLAKASSSHSKVVQEHSTWIKVSICVQAIALVTLYVYFDLYEIFVHGFTFMVLSDIMMGMHLQNSGPYVTLRKRTNALAIGLIILGKVSWEVENHLCSRHPEIWPMHSIWHLLSGASAYYSTIFSFLCRIDADVTIPKVIGIPMLPREKKTD